MKLIYTLPLLVFFVIAIILWRGLGLHPNQVPSPLINKAVPTFSLATLIDGKLTSNKDFAGKITLVNVWATWCYACAQEHPFLLELSQRSDITLYGLDYKDDKTVAKKWLKQHGNPYKIIAVDQDGTAAIDWGVYGTPETFIVDKKGIIRYKHIGPLTQDVWEQKLKPLIDKIRSES